MFIYQKLIDCSTLRQGFQISVEFHYLLKMMPNGVPENINRKFTIRYQRNIRTFLNDTSNIIILSPSYHRIIHKAKPEWDGKSLSFSFPNGLVEKVKLNKHLNL